MLNLDALRNAKMFDFPFQWGIANGILPTEPKSIQMCDDFPVDSFRYRRFLNGRYLRRPLIQLAAKTTFRNDELPDSYNELGEVLTSSAYRETLSKVTGINLGDAPMEAALWRSDSSTVFAMHDDQAQKLLTHVLYLNHGWNKRNGGVLQILASQDDDDVAFEIVPRLGVSVLIGRADNSWHNITPISRVAPDSRNTITVHFYRPGTSEKDLPIR
ncbi:MAG: 2OG-Fe(II) oxygenase [Magnetococcales bacterium]|nr:2OG-Fe(II) oxygenase [Magnetococcales bacterium]MBF0149503.1 2OG-Fe(II) oxygenase [Magnetococcales bacterium]MBF0347806.1 2OG-Fe(II) oxygenase [Magnetococcales bacterium]MBF0630835.1 2OG-Fe(II) oxygenase [Magnetococcales bacterium]